MRLLRKSERITEGNCRPVERKWLSRNGSCSGREVGVSSSTIARQMTAKRPSGWSGGGHRDGGYYDTRMGAIMKP